jgi:hypothetical protein
VGEQVQDPLRVVDPHEAQELERFRPKLGVELAASDGPFAAGYRRRGKERLRQHIARLWELSLRVVEPLEVRPEHRLLSGLPQVPNPKRFRDLVDDPESGIEGVDRLLEDHPNPSASHGGHPPLREPE